MNSFHSQIYGNTMASTISGQNNPNASRGRRNGNAQARYWLGTVHSAHGVFVPQESLIGRSGLVWLRGQQEVGQGGTQHWQLFASFSKKVRLNTVKGIINGHWEPSRSDAAEEYVWKEDTRVEGTQFELGERPFKRNSATDWGKVRDLARAGEMDAIADEFPQVWLSNYRTLKQIKVDNMVCPPDLPGPCGKWVYGPPGVGKSYWVRQQWGQDLYIKAQNKWWDGYQGQKFVLLDDFDCSKIGHLLKQWLDAYAITAETKGGTIQIRPDVFIITSNYTPEQIFDDPVLAEAVSRRCQRIFIPIRRY